MDSENDKGKNKMTDMLGAFERRLDLHCMAQETYFFFFARKRCNVGSINWIRGDLKI